MVLERSLALCATVILFPQNGQAVTFVDPAVGQAASSRPLPASRAQGRDHARGDAEQELPFRMAVEASALCEMEQSLRVGVVSTICCILLYSLTILGLGVMKFL